MIGSREVHCNSKMENKQPIESNRKQGNVDYYPFLPRSDHPIEPAKFSQLMIICLPSPADC